MFEFDEINNSKDRKEPESVFGPIFLLLDVIRYCDDSFEKLIKHYFIDYNTERVLRQLGESNLIDLAGSKSSIDTNISYILKEAPLLCKDYDYSNDLHNLYLRSLYIFYVQSFYQALSPSINNIYYQLQIKSKSSLLSTRNFSLLNVRNSNSDIFSLNKDITAVIDSKVENYNRIQTGIKDSETSYEMELLNSRKSFFEFIRIIEQYFVNLQVKVKINLSNPDVFNLLKGSYCESCLSAFQTRRQLYIILEHLIQDLAQNPDSNLLIIQDLVYQTNDNLIKLGSGVDIVNYVTKKFKEKSL
jgi:hypothetical protein